MKQAMQTFAIVRPELRIGLFTGEIKNSNCDITMASVQTLGKLEYLDQSRFNRDEFQYIIIDEVHLGVAKNYSNMIEYFTPEFLLGLTATPDRIDSKDVFVIFDYNIVYEVRLKEAIDKGWLVPFRYYGIYDDTMDYNEIEFKNGRYDEKMLEEALMIHMRTDLILQHYQKYNSRKALGFCTSRAHAEYMAKYFCENKLKAAAIYSGEMGIHSMDRETALSKLNAGELQVIFSVDMSNEGLDIPAVDMVMFLRPTQYPTVFLQQLGRGLRRSIGKKYLNVLDFIGNYKKTNLIPGFLTGRFQQEKDKVDNQKGMEQTPVIPAEEDFPEDCLIDFDFRLIDYFKRFAEAEKKSNVLKDIVIQFSKLSLPQFIIDEYYRIKEYVGGRPSRLQFYTFFEEELNQLIKADRKFFRIIYGSSMNW